MTQYIYNDLTKRAGALELPAGAISLSQILQALEIAKEIDWANLVKIIENKDEQLAVLTTAEDIARLIAPFVPQAALAAGVLELLIQFVKHTYPVDPYSVPGYHWDMLYGWVPNEEETK
jgi:pyruvate-formate lyase-activating enzyme